MLQSLKDRMTGPLLWFVIGIIVIPFAFFGIETFRSGGTDPTVARVGDQKITQSQLRAGYDQRLAQLQAMMGDGFRADLIDQRRFRQAVLDDMVQELVLRQHVQDAGYRASDALLFDALSTIPAFQENGRFSSEAYRNRLALQGYTPARFEKQMRDSLLIDQMREGILASTIVSDAAAAQAWRVERQRRQLAYAVYEASRYLPRITVDATQVQARYEEQKARYLAPERMRLAYVELSLDALPPADRPADEVLKVLYDADRATRFSTPEERRARHILINFGADKAAARTRLESVAEKIRKGADFASMARSHSEDGGSAGDGGDLGWIRLGQMTEKFERALFGLKAGELSEPIETEFGWHLIRVEQVREATTRAFSDPAVQAELLRIYRRRDAERRYQDYSDQLERLAFEVSGSLDPAAKALGSEVRMTDWFTRAAGDGIAAHSAVREAAFSADVLEADENSRLLSIGDNHLVVVRKAGHEPSRQRPLEEVADLIRDQLRHEQARAQAVERAQATLAALAEGHPLERAAREQAGTFKAPGWVGRNHAELDAAVLEALFRLPRPDDGRPRYSSVTLPNGDAVVVALTAVEDAVWPPESEQERRLNVARLREAMAGAEFSAYLADLQRRVKVKFIAQPDSEPTPFPQ
jgi:peptidyl-prolyl cis-trans isomerase D